MKVKSRLMSHQLRDEEEEEMNTQRGEDVIIGVNKYPVEEDVEVEALDIDNSKVLKNQIRRLDEIRQKRDEGAVTTALEALAAGAEDPSQNLLALAIEAARVRASTGSSASVASSSDPTCRWVSTDSDSYEFR